MAKTAIFVGFDPISRQPFDENNKPVNQDKLPSIYLTNNSLYNLKLAVANNSGGFDDYQNIDASSTIEGMLEKDYDNPTFNDMDSANWTVTTGAEYEYNTAIAVEPDSVYENETMLTRGTAGALGAGEWDYSATKIIVRLSDDSNPDTHAGDYIQYVPVYTPLFAQIQADEGV